MLYFTDAGLQQKFKHGKRLTRMSNLTAFPKNTEWHTLEVRTLSISDRINRSVTPSGSWVTVSVIVCGLNQSSLRTPLSWVRAPTTTGQKQRDGKLENTNNEKWKTPVNVSLLTYAIIYRPHGWVILFVQCRAFCRAISSKGKWLVLYWRLCL